MGNLVFANPAQASAASSDHLLVVAFLRGGCDGLSLVAPYDDPIYIARRDSLAVRAALPIESHNTTFESSVGLHPSAAPLKELYDTGDLAVVHACGLPHGTRSHFEAMDSLERGIADDKSVTSGWLARHLQCVQPDGTLPVLAANAAAPVALLSDPQAVATTDPRSYALNGSWHYTANPDPRYQNAMLKSVTTFYNGTDRLHVAARRTIETIHALEGIADYRSAVRYPEGSFGESLRTVAQISKLDLGLRVATVDLGGWDHHEAQGVNDPAGPFSVLVDQLARGLHAFYNDLASVQKKLTVVVMSEFGRRLGKNVSEGTDHGRGNTLLVLGGQVNGGKIYGSWPGLHDEQLDQREDLKVTTDIRTVLSEIVLHQCGNARLGVVFPGITPAIYSASSRLGIVTGSDTTIDYAAS